MASNIEEVKNVTGTDPVRKTTMNLAKTYIGYGEDGRPFDVVAEIQGYLDKIAVLEKELSQLKKKTSEIPEVKVVKKHER